MQSFYTVSSINATSSHGKGCPRWSQNTKPPTLVIALEYTAIRRRSCLQVDQTCLVWMVSSSSAQRVSTHTHLQALVSTASMAPSSALHSLIFYSNNILNSSQLYPNHHLVNKVHQGAHLPPLQAPQSLLAHLPQEIHQLQHRQQQNRM